MQKAKTSRSKQAEVWYENVAKKTAALGECIHRARRKLVNSLILKAFTHDDGNVYCVRCGEAIEGEFHIDHIDAWQFSDAPKQKYFDVENIGLSHPLCNSLARRNHRKFTPEQAAIRNAVANRVKNQKQYFRRKLKLQRGENHDKDESEKAADT